MGNLWKDLAIGGAHAVATAIPAMEESDRRDVELGIRKETHDVSMQKVKADKEFEQGLSEIYMKHKNTLSSPGQGPAAIPTTPQPTQPVAQITPQPAGQPEQVWGDAGVTVRGASNVDTGTGVEIGPKINPVPQNGGAIGPTKQAPQVQTPQVLNARGSMISEMHDYAMSKGKFNEAKLLKKAEMDNILQVMKISPKAGLQAWNNSPWLVEQFGPLDANALTKEGEWGFLKFGDDGLIRWNKDGRYEVVQKPTGTGGSVNKQLKGNTPDGRPVSYNPKSGGFELDDGRPYTGKIIPAVERVVHESKPERLTMSDARSYASAKLQGIKNRMMIDMTPEERMDFANMPAENLMAALLGGSGRSLPADKKEAYKKEIEAVEQEYEGMANQVLGRKGRTPKEGVIGKRTTKPSGTIAPPKEGDTKSETINGKNGSRYF